MAQEFGRAIPGDGFDGWQNYWNLWWVKTALIDEHTNPFFTNLLFYPTGVSLLFHTLNVFNGILSLPLQLAFGLFPAYNTVVLLSFVLGGFGAYLLVRQILGIPGGKFPALAAGVIFSFSPFHFAHLLGHLQVISLEWIPFYALYLVRIFQVPQRIDGNPEGIGIKEMLLAALFLVLIGLCDLYYVLYCLLFTGVVLAWAFWRGWRSRRTGRLLYTRETNTVPDRLRLRNTNPLPGAIWRVVVLWILFLVVLSPQLVPMVREVEHLGWAART